MGKMNWNGRIASGEPARARKLPAAEDSPRERRAAQPDQVVHTDEGERRREATRPRRQDVAGSASPQPEREPEHTVVRSGRVQRREDAEVREPRSGMPSPPPSVVRGGGSRETAQPEREPERTVVRSGRVQRREDAQAREPRSGMPSPPPSVVRGGGSRETAQPERKPEHTVVRSGRVQTREDAEAREPRSGMPAPPPSVDKESGSREDVQPEYDAGARVSIDVGSYRRRRSGRTFGGDELFSPVNIVGMLMTLAGLAVVVLNWRTVTLTLARGILYVIVNLGTILLLLLGLAVLVFLVRGRRGRGGMLRRMFR